MSTVPPIQDSALVSYGLLAGSVRVFVPPVFDLPFVRSVRGAMFDRLARSMGVTLTVEARRVLADLEEPTSGRGLAEQAVRWIAGRIVPGGPMIDALRNVLRTYAAGVLFRKYLTHHRVEPRDPVLTVNEAVAVRRALRTAIEVASLDHLRAMGHLALGEIRRVEPSKDLSTLQTYSDAVVSAIAELPMTWTDVLDVDFERALRQS